MSQEFTLCLLGLAAFIAPFVLGFLFLRKLRKHQVNFNSYQRVFRFLYAVNASLFMCPTIIGIGHGILPVSTILGIAIMAMVQVTSSSPDDFFFLPPFVYGANDDGVFLLPSFICFLFCYFGAQATRGFNDLST